LKEVSSPKWNWNNLAVIEVCFGHVRRGKSSGDFRQNFGASNLNCLVLDEPPTAFGYQTPIEYFKTNQSLPIVYWLLYMIFEFSFNALADYLYAMKDGRINVRRRNA